MSFALDQIPGYQEALLDAQIETVRTQEDDWLGVVQVIGGEAVRTATLRDYVLLLRFAPSVLHRQLPDPAELLLTLWILSPERERWDYSPAGWRKWFPSLRQLARWRHQRRCRSVLRLAEIEEAAAVYALESDQPFELPEEHPYALTVAELTKYFDRIFSLRPASMRGGAVSGMHWLVFWFNTLQRNFHLPTEEVWAMPLPILLARLRDQQQFDLRGNVPDFNRKADELNRRIMAALRAGETTEADLLAGKFKLN